MSLGMCAYYFYSNINVYKIYTAIIYTVSWNTANSHTNLESHSFVWQWNRFVSLKTPSMVGPLAFCRHPNLNLHYQLPATWGQSPSKDDKPTTIPLPKREVSTWFPHPKELGKNGVFFHIQWSFQNHDGLRTPNWPWWWPLTCCTNVSIDPLVLPSAPSILAAWIYFTSELYLWTILVMSRFIHPKSCLNCILLKFGMMNDDKDSYLVLSGKSFKESSVIMRGADFKR